jgi:hypothetical protein
MFHGGTIFTDAASKYIHVSNQVSLGARSGFGKRLEQEGSIITVIMVSLQLESFVRLVRKRRLLIGKNMAQMILLFRLLQWIMLHCYTIVYHSDSGV